MQKSGIAGNDLISVIVPVYNAAAYLREALDSLAAQSYGNFEAILVNDGSTDGSRDICAEYCRNDKRFKIIDRENGGLSVARNTGLNYATGQYITFVDADDGLHRQALERLLDTIKHTDTDIVAANFYRDGNHNRQIADQTVEILEPVKAIELTLYQHITANHAWGVLYRREMWTDLRFRPSTWYEDLDIFYRIFERARSIAYLPAKLYFYRDNADSFINTFSTARLDVLDVTDRIVEYMRLHHRQLVEAAEDRRFSAHFNMLLLVLRHNSDMTDTIDRCMSVIRQRRRAELRNPKVRLKNKVGAALSYLGRPTLRLLAKIY